MLELDNDHEKMFERCPQEQQPIATRQAQGYYANAPELDVDAAS